MTTPKQIEAAVKVLYHRHGIALLEDTWRAVLEAAEAAAWEPIETAPTDGTQVDLWCDNPKFGGGRVPDCHWYGSGWLGDVLNATHWRHRPAPPKP